MNGTAGHSGGTAADFHCLPYSPDTDRETEAISVRHLNRYSVYLLMRAVDWIYDKQSKISQSPSCAQLEKAESTRTVTSSRHRSLERYCDGLPRWWLSTCTRSSSSRMNALSSPP